MSFHPNAPSPHAPGYSRTAALALLGVLALAAFLRLFALDQAPPGLHQDEAANAWNARCLLVTGRDQVGARWPIFCMRAIGDYRSTLYTYTMIPFQAVGGLNFWTIRLPAAVGGVATVLLLYWVSGRLFGRGTGLAAAALLAVNPAHLQMSRLGLEASQTPLLTLVPFAALLWARFPLSDQEPGPRAARALAAGLMTGVCCYGYPAVRLFVPLFLLASVLVTWPGWWQLMRTRRGAAAIGTLLLGFLLTFGPLAYQHVAEPDVIGKRGRTTWIWTEGDSTASRVTKVLDRYVQHYAPSFLFVSGDEDETFWTVPLGFLPAYYAPLLAVGLLVCLGTARRSRAARVLIAGLVLYPVADAMNWHISLHGLRSSAGLWPLVMLAGLGVSRPIEFLHRRRLQAWLLATGTALIALTVPGTIRFVYQYFIVRPQKMPVYYGTHQDLLAACEWLRPRLNDVDRVICFAAGPNVGYTPYLITLISLRHDPRQWFAEERDIRPIGAWDRCVSYGKFYFLYGEEREPMLEELRADGRDERVVLFLRTDEPPPCEPTAHIDGPDGHVTILICDCHL